MLQDRVAIAAKATLCLLGSIVLTAGLASPSWAQATQSKPASRAAYKNSINANTVTIIAGSVTGTYLRLADDIARSIGESDDLRILPIRGSGSNVRDLLYLRGIDMGIIRSDVFDAYRDKEHYEDLRRRLTYISVLHLEEFHLMASNPKIKTVWDLEGKTVAFPYGAHMSGLNLLGKLGVNVGKIVHGTMFTAAAQAKDGKVDAMLHITGKPFGAVERLVELNPGLRFIPIPFEDALLETSYVPTELTARDYPTLIKPADGKIRTVAVTAILGAFNWRPDTDRYRRLMKFTQAFFTRYNDILRRPGRHPKWDDVNPAAIIEGWSRFPPAALWLAQHRESLESERPRNERALLRKFKKFVRSKPNLSAMQIDEEREDQGIIRARHPSYFRGSLPMERDDVPSSIDDLDLRVAALEQQSARKAIKVGMAPGHPGAFVLREVMEPLGLSIADAASSLKVEPGALHDLVHGRAPLSIEMAMRLEVVFAMDADQLMRQQAWWDVHKADDVE